MIFFLFSHHCAFRLADIIHHRSYDFISRYDFLFQFTSTFKRQQKLIEKLHKFTESVIKARRNELLNHFDEIDEDSGKKKKALLDLLLTSTIEGKSLNDSDIREEIDTFMFEVVNNHYNVQVQLNKTSLLIFHCQGHDTTASGIAFTLYNIAKHGDIQRKCFEEVQSVLSDDDNLTMQ